MIEYVTLPEQKKYSSILHGGKDDEIVTLIQALSAGVKDYLKDFSPYQGERNNDDDYVVDSNFEPNKIYDSEGVQMIRPQVKLAVLVWVDMHLNPMKYPGADMNGTELPAPVRRLLYPLRDPTVK